MRRGGKTFLPVVLVASMLVGFAACGKGGRFASVETPIRILTDHVIISEENGKALFEEELEKLMGIDIVFIQSDGNYYYDDAVSGIFSDSNLLAWPDIILLDYKQYVDYAASGVLADLTSAWEDSDLKKSGRVKNEQVVDGLRVNGRLYGIAPMIGNGYVTYIKQTWLDKANITKLPSNYEEYTQMLKAFSAISPDGYVLTVPGILNKENPYMSYLPEFLWDACPDFYQKEDGVWVDGFTEKKMEEAFERLIIAYKEGWIDPEYAENEISACLNKFYMDKCGVFTYWAGEFANNLLEVLKEHGTDSGLVPMPPIEEAGVYAGNSAPVWAITSACKYPEEVFRLFFGTMLDGAKGQLLWTYGVEEVHWSTHAETITIAERGGAVTYEYAEGEFHGKKSMENRNFIYDKNYLDPLLSIADFADGEDIGFDGVDSIASKSQKVFKENCVLMPEVFSGSAMEQVQAEIMSLRIQLANKIVSGELSIDAAMEEYHESVGGKVQTVLDFLNGFESGERCVSE